MLAQSETLQSDLQQLVGTGNVRAATAADAIDGVVPRLVVAPGTMDEAGRVLRYAQDAMVRVAPRGGGTKLGWGNRPQGVELVVSSQRLNRVVEHAAGDMTVVVEAGCTVAELSRTLARHGQQLALDPLWPEQATVGGIIATNDSGSLRIRFGAIRDLIIGITVVLPDGTVARSGGKVVKNVAGYDLPKLMTGAYGTLGMIVEAAFRLYPIPHARQNWSMACPSIDVAQGLASQILDSTMVPTGLQLRAGAHTAPVLDVRIEGTDAGIATQGAQLERLSTAAAAAIDTGAEDTIWTTPRHALWSISDKSVVAKVSLLPAQLVMLHTAIARVAAALRLDWSLVWQGVGVGLLRLDAPNEQALLAALLAIRQEVEAASGALVALALPPSIKERVDVWGRAPSALALMHRVKQHFDPYNVLNPGRMVGGI